MRLRRPGTTAVDPVVRLLDYAHVQVRAGVLDGCDLLADVTRVASEDVGGEDPARLATDAVAEARARARQEQSAWPPVTDHDRLEAVFDRLREGGVAVLPAVEDHWSAARELERRDEMGESLRGIAWFTLADIWHAVGHGMLEVNLWHGDSANVAAGDALLEETLDDFAAEGLGAHFDEGRIEVGVSWQRRVG
ncbi:MAG: hypothetical protein M3419_12335 [Actinomycetota bacterium]|nr:hypothetical protein [Actinomycetota bacterium]